MRQMDQVSVAEAKQHLGDLLGRVAYGNARVTITRRGKPMALLVPVGDVGASQHLADARGWLDARDPFFKIMDRIVKARHAHRPRVVSA